MQVTLPAEVLRSSNKVYFTHFRNSKLFMPSSAFDKSSDLMVPADWLMSNDNVGDVIGATVSGITVKNLETCVVYRMKKAYEVACIIQINIALQCI